jgi:DNA gyrase subunit A
MPIVNLLPMQQVRRSKPIIDTRDFAGERNLFFATRQGVSRRPRSTSTTTVARRS